jgi:hypothetical protein
MKTIVSVQEITELEIKPSEALSKWRSLVQIEITNRWADKSGWINIDCSACGSKNQIPAFKRHGLDYAECGTCGTLYMPLRPSEKETWWWYRDSKPAVFWRKEVLPESEPVRNEKIVYPRVDWILDSIAENAPFAKRMIDLSTNSGSFLNKIASSSNNLEIVAAGMTADLDDISNSRVQISPTSINDLDSLGSTDVVVIVDLLDRVTDLRGLADKLYQIVKPGGIIFITVPVASGFEIQTLWEHSPTVMPPDKINLPTIEGLMYLFKKPAWDVLELSTPGMFDVEIIHREMKVNPKVNLSRPLKTLIQGLDNSGRIALVEFLQSQRLTSFARLTIKKK